MTKEQFYPAAYYLMYLSRLMEDKLKELYRKGYVKGTVIQSYGNEATMIGMTLPFRPGKDIISLLHRDMGAHLVVGASPYFLMCQYLANQSSPTHGREGNVHHGNAHLRRFPMISHLGDMLAPTVGGVWAARKNGEKVFGLTTIGDGGSSTGDFHESLNLASVHKVPILFIIENNHYAYSTPVKNQYNCKHLSDRAAGYGIEGKTIDGTDVWEVYNSVCDALEGMDSDSLPRLIECMTLRLEGHAVYDNAEYVSQEEHDAWLVNEPLKKARVELLKCGFTEDSIRELENSTAEQVMKATLAGLEQPRPSPDSQSFDVFAKSRKLPVLKPFKQLNIRNLNAVNAALDYILAENPRAFLCGQDIGRYGSAFKQCKGLIDKYGSGRVIDMPICESATVGFCLGASQTGSLPVMEFQFADFATEAVTQLGLNAGTWFFRTDKEAPLLFRMPCGGGITLGAFHSGEFDGLWSRFPGLKLFYPVTPQETFEALIAGFYDPNPCIIFEHKSLYWGKQGDVDFDGDLSKLVHPRQYTEGNDLTIVAWGAMVQPVLNVIRDNNYSVSLWNPFILNPLMIDPIIESIESTGRFMVVQESGETAGLGDRLISIASRKCFGKLKRAPALVSAPDIPVPFAKELESFYLPNQEKIKRAIESIIGERV